MTWILLAIIGYLVFALWQANRNLKTYQLLAVQYLRLIFLFLNEMKGGEKELYKQILRSYVFEYHNEDTVSFNEPWEALAKACNLQPTYKDVGGINVVSRKTVEEIASMLYTSNQIFKDVAKQLPRTLTIKELERRAGKD